MPGYVPVVFVVDDDISVRESLELFIAEAGWRPQVLACAQDFLAGPRPSGPNCLILDVNLPDLNGLELQRRMAADGSATPIIFITGYADIPTTVRAMKAGAVEFLPKPLSPDLLLGAIRGALERSRAYLDQHARLQVLRDRLGSLTRREREVMELVVRGQLNKQAGGELGISEITVKAHRGRIMRKMRARSLPELVSMAARLGLVIPGND